MLDSTLRPKITISYKIAFRWYLEIVTEHNLPLFRIQQMELTAVIHRSQIVLSLAKFLKKAE